MAARSRRGAVGRRAGGGGLGGGFLGGRLRGKRRRSQHSGDDPERERAGHVEGNPGGPAAGPGVPSFAGRPVAGRIAGCPQNLDRQKKDGRLGLGAYQAVML